MANKFDQQREQVDALDARVRFQNQEANAREQIGLALQQGQLKANQARRKLGEQFVTAQFIDPVHARIDQQQAAAEAQQGTAPPPVNPNAGMIPVSPNMSAVNPQASGGPQAAESILNAVTGGGAVQSRGGGVPAAPSTAGDFLGMNQTDPTQGGTHVGQNIQIDPATGRVTQTNVGQMRTGIRLVDAANSIVTALTGKPFLKDTQVGEDFGASMQIYNERSQAAQNAAAAAAQAAQEARLNRQEERLTRQEAQDQKEFELRVKAQEFQARQEARMANQQQTQNAFANFDDANSLRGQFLQTSRPFLVKRDAAAQIIELGANPTKAGDRSMRFLHATTLQPDGRLSDKDVELVNNIGSWADYAKNFANMAVEGLTEAQIRDQIVNDTRQRFKVSYDQWKDLHDQYTDQANRHGFNPKDVVIDIKPLPAVKANPDLDKATGAKAVGTINIQ